MNHISVSYSNLIWAYALIIINIVLSIKFHLGIHKKFFIASIRTIIQLLILGIVLTSLFELQSVTLITLALIIMTINAGVESTLRSKYRFKKLFLTNISATFLTLWPISFFAIYMLNPKTWYDPQYILPFMGMILGNALTSISIGVDRYLTEIKKNHDALLAQFALGATNQEAQKSIFKESLLAAMIPNINAMSSIGIVNIPGMMTGQLITGANPLEASKYQILIMFLISSGAFLGTTLSIYFCYKHFFKRDALLCYE